MDNVTDKQIADGITRDDFLPDFIDLFRMIRGAGRSNVAKPEAVNAALEAAATVIQQAFAERDGEIERLRRELAELRANSIRFAGGSPLTVGGGSVSSRTVHSVGEALAAKGDSRG